MWVTDRREGRNKEKENKEKKRDVEQASLLAWLLEGDMDRQTLPWNRQGGGRHFIDSTSKVGVPSTPLLLLYCT